MNRYSSVNFHYYTSNPYINTVVIVLLVTLIVFGLFMIMKTIRNSKRQKATI
jgi:hypothetical protein